LKRAIVLWSPVALYMAVIFQLSARSDVALPPGIADKPTHTIAYALLGVLFVRALAGGLPARITLRVALLGIALTTAYGVTDEIHQMFVPGRHAEWQDVLADAVGGAIGAATCWLWGIIRVSRHGL
jgi:VanZ family protein